MPWLWVQKKSNKKERERERKKRGGEDQCTNPASYAPQAQKQPHSYVKTHSTITTSTYQNQH